MLVKSIRTNRPQVEEKRRSDTFEIVQYRSRESSMNLTFARIINPFPINYVSRLQVICAGLATVS